MSLTKQEQEQVALTCAHLLNSTDAVRAAVAAALQTSLPPPPALDMLSWALPERWKGKKITLFLNMPMPNPKTGEVGFPEIPGIFVEQDRAGLVIEHTNPQTGVHEMAISKDRLHHVQSAKSSLLGLKG